MYREITNVYVPVKTPDHKKWALLLALLIHTGVLGFIVYTNHTKNLDETVMETTLVTPEQLSAIQGQIAANQNNQAKDTGDSLNPDGNVVNAPSMTEFLAGGSQSNMPAPHPMPSQAAQAVADDLAQQQAIFEKQRNALAEKLDQEAEAELAGVAETIDKQQLENNQTVKEFKLTENNTDNETDALRKESALAAKKLEEKRAEIAAAKNAGNRNISLKADPNASTGLGQTQGGNGVTRAGDSKGGDVAGYRRIVQKTITDNWHPPTNAKDGTSQTAYFDISSNGTISNVRVDGSDSPLKSSLIQAIQNSSLPPPSPEVASRFASNTMRFVVNK